MGASNLEQAALESVQCAFHYCQNKKRIIWQKGSMLLVLWRGFFLSPSWDIFTKQKKAQENPLRKVSVQPFVRGGSATNGNYTFFFFSEEIHKPDFFFLANAAVPLCVFKWLVCFRTGLQKHCLEPERSARWQPNYWAEVPPETSKVPHSFLREPAHSAPGMLGNIQ